MAGNNSKAALRSVFQGMDITALSRTQPRKTPQNQAKRTPWCSECACRFRTRTTRTYVINGLRRKPTVRLAVLDNGGPTVAMSILRLLHNSNPCYRSKGCGKGRGHSQQQRCSEKESQGARAWQLYGDARRWMGRERGADLFATSSGVQPFR
jgi:hypothetical protein